MASTFDRLFGAPQVEGVNAAALAERTTAILPNGPWESQPVRSSRKSCPAKSIATGLSEENVPPDAIFGSRKKRIEEPGKVSGVSVSAALSPRNKGWSGNPRTERCPEVMEPGDKDLFSPSCRPLRRRFPSADKGPVPLPPWLSVGDCSPPSARSASPRGRRSPRWERSRSPSPSSPVRPTSPQDRRVLQWTTGYELDSYRQIKVFPGNVQQQSCAALKPANAAKFRKEEEHDRIIGADGTLKAGCKRRISPNSRGTISSIAFTPPTPETASPSSPVREPLQGLQSARNGDANFSLPTQIPRKRLQPSESPTQSESWTTPVAGVASPRFSWAADMVPDLKEAPGTGRCLSPRSPRSPQRCLRSPHDVVSPRSLIRSNATLGTGLYAEEPQSMLENFLGARKGRSPASRSRGASPLASPYRNDAGESLGFGTLSWGKVSSGGAAGGYGLDVAARQAAGRFHGSGTLNQALNTRGEDITFKEPFLRHRQKVLEQRAQSLRWR